MRRFLLHLDARAVSREPCGTHFLPMQLSVQHACTRVEHFIVLAILITVCSRHSYKICQIFMHAVVMMRADANL